MADGPVGHFSIPEIHPPAAAAATTVEAEAPPRRRRSPAWDPGDRSPLARITDHGLRWGPLALLLFAPLAWGSVQPWSAAVVIAGAAGVGACWLVRLAADPAAAAAERIATSHLRSWSAGLHGPLAALLLLPLVQGLPLGPLVGLVSPAAAELWRTAGAGPARLTASPGATLLAAAELVALALLFFAVLDSLRSRREVRTLAAGLLALGFAYAVGGILWHYTAGWRAFGLEQRVGTSFGPFVNRNHFANLMAMTVPLGVGFLLGIGRRRRRETPGAPGRPASAAGGEREAGARQVLAGFAVAVMGGALAFSLSRGGIVSVCLALAAFALAASSLHRVRGRAALGGAAAAAAVAFAFWLGGDVLLARLGTLGAPLGERSFTGRLELWSETLRMAADHPIFGTGLGSFAEAFPRYRASYPDHSVDHAHGDWLQLFAEGGLAGVLAALALAGAYLTAVVRILRRRRDAEATLLALGGLAGLLAFVAHGTVEFSLHIPANALWFTVLAAWTLKAAASRGG